MAVGTNIVWNTEPVIASTSGSANENGPLFLACFTAPKGPEDLRIVTNDFDSLYGNGSNFSFEKYGQPYLQARRIIGAGGRLLCRRLVHENATYGNLIIGATVTTKKVQKADENGELLYKETAATVAAKYEASMVSNGSTTIIDKTDENGEVLYKQIGGDDTEIPDSQILEDGRLEDGSVDPAKYEKLTVTVEAGDLIHETNENGEKLYILKGSTDGNKVTESEFVVTEVTKAQALMEDGKTIDPSYEPATEEVEGSAEITLYTASQSGVKDTNDIKKMLESVKEDMAMELPIDENEDGIVDKTVELYPLFAVMDNGRGNTGKRVRIDFKSIVSNTNRQAIYTMTDVENSVDITTTNFTLDPDTIFNGKSYAITKETNPQFICAFSEGGYLGFINKLNEITGRDKVELRRDDLLFGKTYKGEAIPGITMGADSVDLSYSLGLSLINGEDGADISFGTDAYNALTEEFFKPKEETDGEVVYNTDIYKIDVVADANYSMQTKANIVELAEFRKDFLFFRDLGLNLGDENGRNTQLGDGLKTYSQVYKAALNDNIVRSKFAGTYCTSYKVYDPYTQKPIHVTSIYSLVDHIVSHFLTGRHLPFAGYSITDYIEGTIDFIPKQTPNVNQKELLEAIKVNCMSFTSLTNFMIETMMTSTLVDGQLNYIQNVLAVQHVIKDIRTYCPMYRTNFTGSGDFEKYANDIYENVLLHHSSNFTQLDFVYDNEDEELSNGEFIASLIFSFNRYIQSETFNIYAED